ncbi:uncharacterized protein LOC134934685 [Pseudophryne corroboree]|uniref:uncharacterized protein LOC134934685 n=1 Tax=Pseudophryne corroboree TaxID=495146 RepID=UPI0030815F83
MTADILKAGKDVLVKRRVSDCGAHLCVGGVKAVQDIRLPKTGKQKSVLLVSSQETNSVNHETATTESQNEFSSDEQPVNVPKVTRKRKRIKKPEERIRAPKFTPAENDVLIQGVVKNYSKLFGRLNGLSVPYDSKESIWREIAMNVSAEGVCVRTAHVCKKRYHDCKSNVKRKMALEKKYVSGTGGGSPIQVDFHSWEVPLQEIVCPAGIFGIEGGIDTGNVKNVQGNCVLIKRPVL